MSYQVLARKWRPRTFRELVGQQHVLQALVNALDHNRLHHAYLFTGTRGVGKTTIARILAKCLNCETGVSSEPCGTCDACLEIADGRFVDLIEVDAASRTKVEDTRELLENVQYAPTRGRYKVYLIDEVHMLSSHSFNALLKTLEEPPPHVKFLLATTDPQKLPVTILSRCLQFHLKNMDPERIVGHLQYVLEQEMVPFEEAALWQLGRAAAGSMRDALSLTDQAIAFGGDKVSDSDVSTMLGTIDQSLVYELLAALSAHNGDELFAAVDRLAEFAPDYAAAMADLLSLLHRIAIAQTVPEAVDNSRGDRSQVLQFAQQIAPETVQLFYQMALLGRRDLPLSPDPRAGFEMALLRMLAFQPQGVHSIPDTPLANEQAAALESHAQIAPAPDITSSSSESVSQPESGTAAMVAEASTPVKKPESSPGPVRAEAPAPEKPVPQSIDLAGLASDPPDPAFANGGSGTGLNAEQMQSLGLKSGRSIAAPEPKQPQEAVDETAADSTTVEAQPILLSALNAENWHQVYSDIGVNGLLQSTVSNCLFSEVQGSHICFSLDQRHAALFDDGHQSRLADLLTQYFNDKVTVSITLGDVEMQTNAETPAARAIRLKQALLQKAMESLEADPLVQSLMREFDAVVVQDSVQPGAALKLDPIRENLIN